jgi:hypothetical protein
VHPLQYSPTIPIGDVKRGQIDTHRSMKAILSYTSPKSLYVLNPRTAQIPFELLRGSVRRQLNRDPQYLVHSGPK